MRRVSDKRRELVESHRERRRMWLASHRLCMLCRRVPPADVHEMARGPARAAAYADERAWLALCRRCHDDCGDYAAVPLAAQYAVKLLRDPTSYDRVWLNEARGRSADAIHESEVLEWLERMGER